MFCGTQSQAPPSVSFKKRRLVPTVSISYCCVKKGTWYVAQQYDNWNWTEKCRMGLLYFASPWCDGVNQTAGIPHYLVLQRAVPGPLIVPYWLTLYVQTREYVGYTSVKLETSLKAKLELRLLYPLSLPDSFHQLRAPEYHWLPYAVQSECST